MPSMNFLLPILVLLPIAVAAVMILLDARSGAGRARGWALLATLATLLLACMVSGRCISEPLGPLVDSGPVHPWTEYRLTMIDMGTAMAPGAAAVTWSRGLKIDFILGMDGISAWLVLITALLCVSTVLASWEKVQYRAVEFYAALLALETGLVGVFCAFDLITFYAFFEFTLIPLFFMIGIWGQPHSERAALKVFLFPLVGSLVTLLGLVSVAVAGYRLGGLTEPFSIPELARHFSTAPLPADLQSLLFCLLAVGMIVKLPLVPVHTWLPTAHAAAPIAGSVLLIKLGVLGLLRLCLPLFPDAVQSLGQPVLLALGAIGVLYGGLAALVQRDITRVLAYGSVAHVGVCVLGLFSLNTIGLTGAIVMLINLGLTTGGLFLVVGLIESRYGTRSLDQLGGLAAPHPFLATAFVTLALASIGLPGLNGFIGEVLALLGVFRVSWEYAAVGAAGMALGAWYLLTVVQHLIFGPLVTPTADPARGPIGDLKPLEFLAIGPVVVACFWLGLFPQPLLSTIEADVAAMTRLYERPKSAPEPALSHLFEQILAPVPAASDLELATR